MTGDDSQPRLIGGYQHNPQRPPSGLNSSDGPGEEPDTDDHAGNMAALGALGIGAMPSYSGNVVPLHG
jgi:hypothetical protein